MASPSLPFLSSPTLSGGSEIEVLSRDFAFINWLAGETHDVENVDEEWMTQFAETVVKALKHHWQQPEQEQELQQLPPQPHGSRQAICDVAAAAIAAAEQVLQQHGKAGGWKGDRSQPQQPPRPIPPPPPPPPPPSSQQMHQYMSARKSKRKRKTHSRQTGDQRKAKRKLAAYLMKCVSRHFKRRRANSEALSG